MQYKIGTATFTNGSSTVTGSGTAWLANVSPGDYLVRVGDAVSYEVASVASDTSLTLTANYGGVTGSGLSYVAHQDFHPNGAPKWANGDVEFAAIQNRWNAQLLAGSFGTAAFLDTGTAPSEVPLNSDLGTAAILDTGTAAGELPTNGDLATGAFTTVGTAATLDTGTAAGELPTNGDLATGAFTTVGTAATADVTTSATDATAGRVHKVGDEMRQIGVGQTWTDVTGSRSAGTTYTNTTGKPIAVRIYAVATAGSALITMDVAGLTVGRAVSRATAAFICDQVTAIVPAGDTYRLSATAVDSIVSWVELR